VGGAIALIGILTLLKTGEKKEIKKRIKDIPEKLGALKESIDKDEEYKTDGYDDEQIVEGRFDEEESPLSGEEITKAEIALLTPAARIARLAELAVKKHKTEGRNCWNWVDNIYLAAGCARKSLVSYIGSYEGMDCGNNHATEKELNKIKPGYHIIYNNKNKSDKYGNHSVIFIKWIDREKKIAEVASYYAAKNRSNLFNVNLNKSPVTRIFEPVVERPVNLAYLNVKQKRKEEEMEVA
jgi:hypothetical protein